MSVTNSNAKNSKKGFLGEREIAIDVVCRVLCLCCAVLYCVCLVYLKYRVYFVRARASILTLRFKWEENKQTSADLHKTSQIEKKKRRKVPNNTYAAWTNKKTTANVHTHTRKKERMKWHIDWGRPRKLKNSPNIHARITMESNKRVFSQLRFTISAADVVVVVVVMLSAANVSCNFF